MIITVAGLKGGTGKTTVAVLLAEAAASGGSPVLLVDTDPQGSAMNWSDLATDDGAAGLACDVISVPTADLAKRLRGILAGYDTIVLDTPPGALAIVAAAIRLADVVVVPTQTTIVDVERARVTLDLATDHGRPALAVLTRVRVGTRSRTDAREAFTTAGIAVAITEVPQRETTAGAYGASLNATHLALGAAILAEVTNRKEKASDRRTPTDSSPHDTRREPTPPAKSRGRSGGQAVPNGR